MKKFLGYIISPVAIIVFFLWLVIFQPIQWVAYEFLGYKAHKGVVDFLDLLLVRTAYLLGDRVIFINKQKLPLDRPKIFVSNHQSLFDIPPLIYFLRRYHAKFISKVELTKGVPSISFNLKYGGGANIDRNDSRQSITEIVKFAIRMKENNWSAIIFPEGTRSKDGTVQHFHAAGIATILKKCPEALLVPIAINNSWRMSQYGLYPLSTFERMTWEVLPPIEPAGRPAEELVAEIEMKIKKALGQSSPASKES